MLDRFGQLKPAPTNSNDPPSRDGNLLVCSPQNLALPAFCLRTNVAVDGPWTTLHLNWCPEEYRNITSKRLDVWTLIMTIREYSNTRTESFAVPLDPDWIRSNRRHKFVGIGLLLLGIAGAIYCIGGYAFASATIADYYGYAALAMAAVAVSGIVYYAALVRGFKITKNEGDCYWVSGASPEFLARLPAYQKKQMDFGINPRS